MDDFFQLPSVSQSNARLQQSLAPRNSVAPTEAQDDTTNESSPPSGLKLTNAKGQQRVAPSIKIKASDYAKGFGSSTNLYSPWVTEEQLLKDRAWLPEVAPGAINPYSQYKGEAKDVVNLFGRLYTRSQVAETDAGNSLLYYMDRIAAGDRRTALDSLVETGTENKWIRFVPYANMIAEVGGSIIAARRAADAFEKMQKGDEVSLEEMVAAQAYNVRAQWESNATAGAIATDIIQDLPALCIGFNLSGKAMSAAGRKLASAFPNSWAARAVAVPGATRHAARDGFRHFISLASEAAKTTDDTAAAAIKQKLYKDITEAIGSDAIKTMTAAKSPLIETLTKLADGNLDAVIKGNVLTAEGKSLIRTAVQANTRVYLDNSIRIAATNTKDTKKLMRLLRVGSTEEIEAGLKAYSSSIAKQAGLADDWASESILKILTKLDTGNYPIANKTLQELVSEGAVHVAKASPSYKLAVGTAKNAGALTKYIDNYSELVFGAPGIKNWAARSLSRARDHLYTGLFDHGVTLIGDGTSFLSSTAAGNLSHALGIMTIEAPVRGAAYTALSLGARELVFDPLWQLTTGYRSVSKNELAARHAAFLSGDAEMMENAFWIGLGMEYSENISESVGQSFTNLGAALAKTKWLSSIHNRLSKWVSATGNSAGDAALDITRDALANDRTSGMLFRRMIGRFIGGDTEWTKAVSSRSSAFYRMLSDNSSRDKFIKALGSDWNRLSAAAATAGLTDTKQIYAYIARGIAGGSVQLQRKAEKVARQYMSSKALVSAFTRDLLHSVSGKLPKTFGWVGDLLSPTARRSLGISCGWNGMFQEWLEERYNGFVTGLFGWNTKSSFDEGHAEGFSPLQRVMNALGDFFPESSDQALGEAIAFLIPGVAASALQHAQYMVADGPLSRMTHALENLDTITNNSAHVAIRADSSEEATALAQQLQSEGIDAHSSYETVAVQAQTPGQPFQGTNPQQVVDTEEQDKIIDAVVDGLVDDSRVFHHTRSEPMEGFASRFTYKFLGLLNFALTGNFSAVAYDPYMAIARNWFGADHLLKYSRLSVAKWARDAANEIIRGSSLSASLQPEVITSLAQRLAGGDRATAQGSLAAALSQSDRDILERLDKEVPQYIRSKMRELVQSQILSRGLLRLSFGQEIDQHVRDVISSAMSATDAMDLLAQRKDPDQSIQITLPESLGGKTITTKATTINQLVDDILGSDPGMESRVKRDILLRALRRAHKGSLYFNDPHRMLYTPATEGDTTTFLGPDFQPFVTTVEHATSADNYDSVVYAQALDRAMLALHTPAGRMSVVVPHHNVDDNLVDSLASYGFSLPSSAVSTVAKFADYLTNLRKRGRFGGAVATTNDEGKPAEAPFDVNSNDVIELLYQSLLQLDASQEVSPAVAAMDKELEKLGISRKNISDALYDIINIAGIQVHGNILPIFRHVVEAASEIQRYVESASVNPIGVGVWEHHSIVRDAEGQSLPTPKFEMSADGKTMTATFAIVHPRSQMVVANASITFTKVVDENGVAEWYSDRDLSTLHGLVLMSSTIEEARSVYADWVKDNSQTLPAVTENTPAEAKAYRLFGSVMAAFGYQRQEREVVFTPVTHFSVTDPLAVAFLLRSCMTEVLGSEEVANIAKDFGVVVSNTGRTGFDVSAPGRPFTVNLAQGQAVLNALTEVVEMYDAAKSGEVEEHQTFTTKTTLRGEPVFANMSIKDLEAIANASLALRKVAAQYAARHTRVEGAQQGGQVVYPLRASSVSSVNRMVIPFDPTVFSSIGAALTNETVRVRAIASRLNPATQDLVVKFASLLQLDSLFADMRLFVEACLHTVEAGANEESRDNLELRGQFVRILQGPLSRLTTGVSLEDFAPAITNIILGYGERALEGKALLAQQADWGVLAAELKKQASSSALASRILKTLSAVTALIFDAGSATTPAWATPGLTDEEVLNSIQGMWARFCEKYPSLCVAPLKGPAPELPPGYVTGLGSSFPVTSLEDRAAAEQELKAASSEVAAAQQRVQEAAAKVEEAEQALPKSPEPTSEGSDGDDPDTAPGPEEESTGANAQRQAEPQAPLQQSPQAAAEEDVLAKTAAVDSAQYDVQRRSADVEEKKADAEAAQKAYDEAIADYEAELKKLNGAKLRKSLAEATLRGQENGQYDPIQALTTAVEAAKAAINSPLWTRDVEGSTNPPALIHFSKELREALDAQRRSAVEAGDVVTEEEQREQEKQEATAVKVAEAGSISHDPVSIQSVPSSMVLSLADDSLFMIWSALSTITLPDKSHLFDSGSAAQTRKNLQTLLGSTGTSFALLTEADAAYLQAYANIFSTLRGQYTYVEEDLIAAASLRPEREEGHVPSERERAVDALRAAFDSLPSSVSKAAVAESLAGILDLVQQGTVKTEANEDVDEAETSFADSESDSYSQAQFDRFAKSAVATAWSFLARGLLGLPNNNLAATIHEFAKRLTDVKIPSGVSDPTKGYQSTLDELRKWVYNEGPRKLWATSGETDFRARLRGLAAVLSDNPAVASLLTFLGSELISPDQFTKLFVSLNQVVQVGEAQGKIERIKKALHYSITTGAEHLKARVDAADAYACVRELHHVVRTAKVRHGNTSTLYTFAELRQRQGWDPTEAFNSLWGDSSAGFIAWVEQNMPTLHRMIAAQPTFASALTVKEAPNGNVLGKAIRTVLAHTGAMLAEAGDTLTDSELYEAACYMVYAESGVARSLNVSLTDSSSESSHLSSSLGVVGQVIGGYKQGFASGVKTIRDDYGNVTSVNLALPISDAQRRFVEVVIDAAANDTNAREMKRWACWEDGTPILHNVTKNEKDRNLWLKANRAVLRRAISTGTLEARENGEHTSPMMYFNVYVGDRNTPTMVALPASVASLLLKKYGNDVGEGVLTGEELIASVFHSGEASDTTTDKATDEALDTLYSAMFEVVQILAGMQDIDAKRIPAVSAVNHSLPLTNSNGVDATVAIIINTEDGATKNEGFFGTTFMMLRDDGRNVANDYLTTAGSTAKLHFVHEFSDAASSTLFGSSDIQGRAFVKGNAAIIDPSNPRSFGNTLHSDLMSVLAAESNNDGSNLIASDYDGIKTGPTKLALKGATEISHKQTGKADKPVRNNTKPIDTSGCKTVGDLLRLLSKMRTRPSLGDLYLDIEVAHDNVVLKKPAEVKRIKFTDLFPGASFADVKGRSYAVFSYKGRNVSAIMAANLGHEAVAAPGKAPVNYLHDQVSVCIPALRLGGADVADANDMRQQLADYLMVDTALNEFISSGYNGASALRRLLARDTKLAAQHHIADGNAMLAQDLTYQLAAELKARIKPHPLAVKMTLVSTGEQVGTNDTVVDGGTGDKVTRFYVSNEQYVETETVRGKNKTITGVKLGRCRANLSLKDDRGRGIARYALFAKAETTVTIDGKEFKLTTVDNVRNTIDKLTSLQRKIKRGDNEAKDQYSKAVKALFVDYSGETPAWVDETTPWNDVLGERPQFEAEPIESVENPLLLTGEKKNLSGTYFFIPGSYVTLPRTPSQNLGAQFMTLRLTAPVSFSKDGDAAKEALVMPPPKSERQLGADNDGDTTAFFFPLASDGTIILPGGSTLRTYTKKLLANLEEAKRQLDEFRRDPQTYDRIDGPRYISVDGDDVTLSARLEQDVAAVFSANYQMLGIYRNPLLGYVNEDVGVTSLFSGSDRLVSANPTHIQEENIQARGKPNLLAPRTQALVMDSGRQASEARGACVAAQSAILSAAQVNFIPGQLIADGFTDVVSARSFWSMVREGDGIANALFDDLKEQVSLRFRSTPQTVDIIYGLLLTTLWKDNSNPHQAWKDKYDWFLSLIDGPSGKRNAFSGVFGNAAKVAAGLTSTGDDAKARETFKKRTGAAVGVFEWLLNGGKVADIQSDMVRNFIIQLSSAMGVGTNVDNLRTRINLVSIEPLAKSPFLRNAFASLFDLQGDALRTAANDFFELYRAATAMNQCRSISPLVRPSKYDVLSKEYNHLLDKDVKVARLGETKYFAFQSQIDRVGGKDRKFASPDKFTYSGVFVDPGAALPIKFGAFLTRRFTASVNLVTKINQASATGRVHLRYLLNGNYASDEDLSVGKDGRVKKTVTVTNVVDGQDVTNVLASEGQLVDVATPAENRGYQVHAQDQVARHLYSYGMHGFADAYGDNFEAVRDAVSNLITEKQIEGLSKDERFLIGVDIMLLALKRYMFKKPSISDPAVRKALQLFDRTFSVGPVRGRSRRAYPSAQIQDIPEAALAGVRDAIHLLLTTDVKLPGFDEAIKFAWLAYRKMTASTTAKTAKVIRPRKKTISKPDLLQPEGKEVYVEDPITSPAAPTSTEVLLVEGDYVYADDYGAADDYGDVEGGAAYSTTEGSSWEENSDDFGIFPVFDPNNPTGTRIVTVESKTEVGTPEPEEPAATTDDTAEGVIDNAAQDKQLNAANVPEGSPLSAMAVKNLVLLYLLGNMSATRPSLPFAKGTSLDAMSILPYSVQAHLAKQTGKVLGMVDEELEAARQATQDNPVETPLTDAIFGTLVPITIYRRAFASDVVQTQTPMVPYFAAPSVVTDKFKVSRPPIATPTTAEVRQQDAKVSAAVRTPEVTQSDVAKFVAEADAYMESLAPALRVNDHLYDRGDSNSIRLLPKAQEQEYAKGLREKPVLTYLSDPTLGASRAQYCVSYSSNNPLNQNHYAQPVFIELQAADPESGGRFRNPVLRSPRYLIEFKGSQGERAAALETYAATLQDVFFAAAEHVKEVCGYPHAPFCRDTPSGKATVKIDKASGTLWFEAPMCPAEDEDPSTFAAILLAISDNKWGGVVEGADRVLSSFKATRVATTGLSSAKDALSKSQAELGSAKIRLGEALGEAREARAKLDEARQAPKPQMSAAERAEAYQIVGPAPARRAKAKAAAQQKAEGVVAADDIQIIPARAPTVFAVAAPEQVPEGIARIETVINGLAEKTIRAMSEMQLRRDRGQTYERIKNEVERIASSLRKNLNGEDVTRVCSGLRKALDRMRPVLSIILGSQVSDADLDTIARRAGIDLAAVYVWHYRNPADPKNARHAHKSMASEALFTTGLSLALTPTMKGKTLEDALIPALKSVAGDIVRIRESALRVMWSAAPDSKAPSLLRFALAYATYNFVTGFTGSEYLFDPAFIADSDSIVSRNIDYGALSRAFGFFIDSGTDLEKAGGRYVASDQLLRRDDISHMLGSIIGPLRALLTDDRMGFRDFKEGTIEHTAIQMLKTQLSQNSGLTPQGVLTRLESLLLTPISVYRDPEAKDPRLFTADGEGIAFRRSVPGAHGAKDTARAFATERGRMVQEWGEAVDTSLLDLFTQAQDTMARFVSLGTHVRMLTSYDENPSLDLPTWGELFDSLGTENFVTDSILEEQETRGCPVGVQNAIVQALRSTDDSLAGIEIQGVTEEEKKAYVEGVTASNSIDFVERLRGVSMFGMPIDDITTMIYEYEPSKVFDHFTMPRVGKFNLRDTMLFSSGEDVTMRLSETLHFIGNLFGVRDPHGRISVVKEVEGVDGRFEDGYFKISRHGDGSAKTTKMIKFVNPSEAARVTAPFGRFVAGTFSADEQSDIDLYLKALNCDVLAGSDRIYTSIGSARRYAKDFILTGTDFGPTDDRGGIALYDLASFMEYYTMDAIAARRRQPTHRVSNLELFLTHMYESLPAQLQKGGKCDVVTEILTTIHKTAVDTFKHMPPGAQSVQFGEGDYRSRDYARNRLLTENVRKALERQGLMAISSHAKHRITGEPLVTVTIPVSRVYDMFNESAAKAKLIDAGRHADWLTPDAIRERVQPAVKEINAFILRNPQIATGDLAGVTGFGSLLWSSGNHGVFSSSAALSRSTMYDPSAMSAEEYALGERWAEVLSAHHNDRVCSVRGGMARVDDAGTGGLLAIYRDKCLFNYSTLTRKETEDIFDSFRRGENVDPKAMEAIGIPVGTRVIDLSARIKEQLLFEGWQSSDPIILPGPAEDNAVGTDVSPVPTPRSARAFIIGYALADAAMSPGVRSTAGLSMKDAFNLEGILPNDENIAGALGQLASKILGACSFSGTLHNMSFTLSEETLPNYLFLPAEHPDQAELFDDRMWGELALWYIKVFNSHDQYRPALDGFVYNPAVTGRTNCRNVVKRIKGYLQSKNVTKYLRVTTQGARDYEGVLKGVSEILCFKPNQKDTRGEVYLDDTHSKLTDWSREARGSEAMGMMLKLLAARAPGVGQQNIFDKICSWSKAINVSWSWFFQIATVFESQVAASGWLNTNLGFLKSTSNLKRKMGSGIWLDLANDVGGILRKAFGGRSLSDVAKEDPSLGLQDLSALSWSDVAQMWESDSPFLLQLKQFCSSIGVTMSSPDTVKAFLDQEGLTAQMGADRLAGKTAEIFARGDANVQAKLQATFANFLRAFLNTNHTIDAFTRLMDVTKMAVTAQLCAKLRAQAILNGRYFDPIREMRKIGNYINEEIGGINPLAHAFDTPEARKWMSRLLFSWTWTMGSWSAGGGTILSNAFLGGNATTDTYRAHILGRWARMYGWIMYGMPFFLQLLQGALAKGLYLATGTPDEKQMDITWLMWNNEEKFRDRFEITPLLHALSKVDEQVFGPDHGIRKAKLNQYGAFARFFANLLPMYTGQNTTGHRLFAMHFAKQGHEVTGGWFQHPWMTLVGKLSSPARVLLEEVAGYSGDPNFPADHVAAEEEGMSRWVVGGSSAGNVLSLAVPFAATALSSHSHLAEPGAILSALGPVNVGMSQRTATQRVKRELKRAAESTGFTAGPLHLRFSRTKVLGILKDASRNGVDPDSVVNVARQELIRDYYSKLYTALPRTEDGPVDESALLAAARALRFLAVDTSSINEKMRKKMLRGGRSVSPGDPVWQRIQTLVDALFGDARSYDAYRPGGLQRAELKKKEDSELAKKKAKGKKAKKGNTRMALNAGESVAIPGDNIPKTLFGMPVVVNNSEAFRDTPESAGMYRISAGRDLYQGSMPRSIFGMPVATGGENSYAVGRPYAGANDAVPRSVFGFPVTTRGLDGADRIRSKREGSFYDPREKLAADDTPASVFGLPVSYETHKAFKMMPNSAGFYQLGSAAKRSFAETRSAPKTVFGMPVSMEIEPQDI